MDTTSSSDLITELQQGNLEALGALYDRYHQLVYRTAFAITCDPDAAADLMQDVFLRMYRYAASVDVERPLEPWLYRVTTNLALTWVKRRYWIRPLEEVADWLTGDRPNMVQKLIELDDDWQRVHRAMAKLTVAQRIVLVLYYVNALSLKEISEILEIPVGTVKSRLHYGRKALKKQLSKQDGAYPDGKYEFT